MLVSGGLFHGGNALVPDWSLDRWRGCWDRKFFLLSQDLRGAEQAAEKPRMAGEGSEERSAGAEALIDFAAIAARLKPCPCYKSRLE